MTDGNEYTEHRLKVARTARWGLIGTLGDAIDRIWIALHGYGQLASEFAASAQWPRSQRRAFVFPEALQRFYLGPADAPHVNAAVAANWMTRDARLDDIADNHAYLDALLAAVLERAPKAKVGVLGFSQGAATAARWAEARASQGQPLSALVLWGALCPPEVDLGPDAPLGATQLMYACGMRDRWITPKLIQAEQQRLASARRSYHLNQFDGGHRLDDNTLLAVLTLTSL